MSLITEHNPSHQPIPSPITPPGATCEPLVRTEKAGPLLRGLLAEWESACSSPRALRRVNSWGLPGGRVERLDEVVLRAGFGGPADCDDADAYLLALVSRAAHDPLAAQIVLHRLLPPVISIAKRRGKLHNDGIEGALCDLVAQAWFVITTYPVERRPRKIAANMVRDIEYHEFVAGYRPRKASVEFVAHDNFTMGSLGVSEIGIATSPEDDDVRNLLLELELHGVSEVRREIVRLSCDGWKCTEIGRHLGMPERTVRWNRAEALKAAESYVDEFRRALSTGGAPNCGDEV